MLKPSYYYSSKFARPAQIFWSGISPAKPQRRQGYGERTKTLMNDFHPQSPNFAPFASLREILRVSVAAQPHWVLRGESSLCELCVFARDKSGSRRQMFLQKLHPPVPRQAIGFRDIFFRMVRVHKRVSGVPVNVKFVSFAMLGQLGVELRHVL